MNAIRICNALKRSVDQFEIYKAPMCLSILHSLAFPAHSQASSGNPPIMALTGNLPSTALTQLAFLTIQTATIYQMLANAFLAMSHLPRSKPSIDTISRLETNNQINRITLKVRHSSHAIFSLNSTVMGTL